jgi:putative transposase
MEHRPLNPTRSMPRAPRQVLPGVPHHVTQRGNRRQPTFFRATDYAAYLRISAAEFAKAQVQVLAYCLMPNHVHLIAVPIRPEALAAAVGNTHVKYTRRINLREGWTGCLWQGRFASFPMDDGYLLECVRYVGLNPVRAGLVKRAIDWPWSSVRAHVEGRPDPLVRPGPVLRLMSEDPGAFFGADVGPSRLEQFRAASALGRPLGPLDR